MFLSDCWRSLRAFAHQMGVIDAKEKASTTPRAIWSSLWSRKRWNSCLLPLVHGCSIQRLGRGILVTVLRKLVEREWRQTGHRPNRQRIRKILNEQLVGFDIDGRALRLAELALYLTALELIRIRLRCHSCGFWSCAIVCF